MPVYLQEDMNLNEERKAPLRNKDLITKREMVVQYISATAKSVSRKPFSPTKIGQTNTLSIICSFQLKSSDFCFSLPFLECLQSFLHKIL